MEWPDGWFLVLIWLCFLVFAKFYGRSLD